MVRSVLVISLFFMRLNLYSLTSWELYDPEILLHSFLSLCYFILMVFFSLDSCETPKYFELRRGSVLTKLNARLICWNLKVVDR